MAKTKKSTKKPAKARRAKKIAAPVVQPVVAVTTVATDTAVERGPRLKTSTIRPGYLVSFKTSIGGNVAYQKTVLEGKNITEAGAERARWETTRVIADPAEHEAAKKARGAACSAIRKVCTQSAFGLLCPEVKSAELSAAIAESRAAADEFNAMATLTQLRVYVVCGKIAQDDEEAIRAISSEVRELLEDMEKGVGNLDARAIRDAAARVKSLGEMMSPTANAQIQNAVETARAAARQIVKAGEAAAQEIDREAIKKIAGARTAFLELLDDAASVAVQMGAGRAVDFAPEMNEPELEMAEGE